MTNYRGDVVRILDADGATVASYDYDPWGNQFSTEPTDRRINGQPIRYAGYVYDSETKLYYLQARYYDPQTGRFLSRDPDPGDEDDPITMNGYTYADSNPIMMTDPDGHFAQFIPLAVGGYRLYKGYKAYNKIKNVKALKNFKPTKKYRAPKKAYKVLQVVNKQGGKAPEGYKGGRVFKNKENRLPNNTSYREYDVKPYKKGVNRGAQRLVIGKNGKAYYTKNHYKSFVKINRR